MNAIEMFFCPLYWASSRGDARAVAALLAKQGVNVNQAMNDGATPLFIASQNGHAEVVSMLLAKQGVNVNQARMMVPRHFTLRVRTATPRWCRCCWPSRAST